MKLPKKLITPLVKKLSQKLNERAYVYFLIKEFRKTDKNNKELDRQIPIYNKRCLYGNYQSNFNN